MIEHVKCSTPDFAEQNVEKLLQTSYAGKVKMIYIDPPYNTGHDFVYRDRFSLTDKELAERGDQVDDDGKWNVEHPEPNDAAAARYHSNWCSMMYPRLKLARNLLRDDGVLFMSIDDNEVVNARKLCDEVFGEGNFIGCISRATGTTTGQDAGKIGSSLDYCIVFSKSDLFTLQGLGLDEEDLKRFTEEDEKGRFSYLQLRKTGNADRKEDRPNMFYSVTAPDGSGVYPFGPSNYLSRWRVARSTYDKKASITLKELLGVKGVFDNPKPV